MNTADPTFWFILLSCPSRRREPAGRDVSDSKIVEWVFCPVINSGPVFLPGNKIRLFKLGVSVRKVRVIGWIRLTTEIHLLHRNVEVGWPLATVMLVLHEVAMDIVLVLDLRRRRFSFPSSLSPTILITFYMRGTRMKKSHGPILWSTTRISSQTCKDITNCFGSRLLFSPISLGSRLNGKDQGPAEGRHVERASLKGRNSGLYPSLTLNRLFQFQTAWNNYPLEVPELEPSTTQTQTQNKTTKWNRKPTSKHNPDEIYSLLRYAEPLWEVLKLRVVAIWYHCLVPGLTSRLDGCCLLLITRKGGQSEIDTKHK